MINKCCFGIFTNRDLAFHYRTFITKQKHHWLYCLLNNLSDKIHHYLFLQFENNSYKLIQYKTKKYLFSFMHIYKFHLFWCSMNRQSYKIFKVICLILLLLYKTLYVSNGYVYVKNRIINFEKKMMLGYNLSFSWV